MLSAFLVIGALLLLASCSTVSGSGSSTTSTASTATSTPAGPLSAAAFCALFSQSAVGQITGVSYTSVQPDQMLDPRGTVDSCLYTQTSGGVPARIDSITSIFCPDVSTCHNGYVTSKQQIHAQSPASQLTDLSGLGDEAFSVTNGSGGEYRILFRKGAILTETVATKADLSVNEQLAQYVLGKLP